MNVHKLQLNLVKIQLFTAPFFINILSNFNNENQGFYYKFIDFHEVLLTLLFLKLISQRAFQ